MTTHVHDGHRVRFPDDSEVVMRPIGVLDEQRFLIDTLLTSSGTVVKVRYPALDLAHTGSPKEQRLLMQQLRADVARALLTSPRLIHERHRWPRAIDPRHVALIEGAPTLACTRDRAHAPAGIRRDALSGHDARAHARVRDLGDPVGSPRRPRRRFAARATLATTS